MASACARPLDGSDVHLALDSFALLQRPRTVETLEKPVDALYVTSISPASSKLMLNVGLDDYGIVERRDCGCPLAKLGLDVHLREIRSFAKLTGEGVSLVHNDVANLLQSELPRKFGGTALDYQLAEKEGKDGLTKLVLRVHPRLDLDEEAVRRTVLEGLRSGGLAAGFAGRVWEQGDNLQVHRCEPAWTSVGKLLPLRQEKIHHKTG
jgi:hypothetical protein